MLAGFVGVPLIDAFALGWERNQPEEASAIKRMRLFAAPGERGGSKSGLTGILAMCFGPTARRIKPPRLLQLSSQVAAG